MATEPLQFTKQEKLSTTSAVSLIRTEDDTRKVSGEDDTTTFLNLAGYIRAKLTTSETRKRITEHMWQDAYRNYRSKLGKMPKVRESERSRASLKLTKVKVLAAYGQIIDVLFGSKDFPIELTETPVPEGISKEGHLNVNNEPVVEAPIEEDIFGFPGDGRDILAGTTSATPANLGGLEEKYKGITLVEGKGALGEPTVDLASEAARNLNRYVKDQLSEAKAAEEIRKVIFETCLLGSGVLKGPFNFNKEIARWTFTDEGTREYTPVKKVIPRPQYVSSWNLYLDPAANNINEAQWIIERHKFNREQLRNLISQEGFIKANVELCIHQGPNYDAKYWEFFITDTQQQSFSDRWEVLEYWGVLDKKMAMAINLPGADQLDELDSVQINAWTCGNETLRVIINPFKPERIPYMLVPYETDPYNPWGVGIPENMDDSQMIINGALRMAIDNLALSGNVILEIDDNMLVSGQSMEIYPGKIFRRQSGVRGNAINSIQIPNTAPANLEMVRTAMQFADMETGIPSVLHGQTGVSGTGRTSSGLSMLLSNASMSIKTVIKNLDDHLFVPLGFNMFYWNMQFNPDVKEIQGDIQIRAKATASLGMREIRSQRILTFLQIGQNPLFVPWFRWEKLLKEFAIAMELDPDEVINSPAEAAIMAERLKGLLDEQRQSEKAQGSNGQSSGVQGSGGLFTGTTSGNSQEAGGGGIGPGNVSSPGGSGFTGNVS
jgi:hypothetical protein